MNRLHELAAIIASDPELRKINILVVDDGPPPLPVFKEIKNMEIVLHPSTRAGTFVKNIVEPGRNKPCHCGSGKKYKHCCLDKNYAETRKKVAAASVKNMKAQERPE